MPSLFLLWKRAWVKWIEPQLFSTYKDPNPTFSGSAFCIEQYALGNAIYHFTTKQSSSVVLNENLISKYVNKIERNLIIIGDEHAEEEENLMKNRDKLANLVNTAVLSNISFNMPSIHFYTFVPIYSFCSQSQT